MFPPPSTPGIPSSPSWPTFASIDQLHDQFASFSDRAEHVLGFTKSTRMWYRNGFERTRNAAIIGVALYAGLRKREIIRLEYRDVDLEEGTIFIRRGKGKNGGKDRTAYIASELRMLLATYIRARRARQVTAPE